MTTRRFLIITGVSLGLACVFLALAGVFHSSLLGALGVVAILVLILARAVWEWRGTGGRELRLWAWCIIGAIVLAFVLRELS